VKYLLRKCEEANFISHCDRIVAKQRGAIFHNFRKEIISHSATPNISLKPFVQQVAGVRSKATE
jgi:hypothetical protein